MNSTAPDNINIAVNFSRYAHLYDRYADAQRLAAVNLLKQSGQDNHKQILEIGCGTGNYTRLLAAKFNQARIHAVDISVKMIELAREKLETKGSIEFSVADAEKMNLSGNFDLATSNACFQWFGDFDAALEKYKNILNKKGIILFSMFGPLTFTELSAVIKDVFGNTRIEAANFKTKDQVREALRANFKKIQVKELIFSERFSSLLELLRKIKYSGISGNGLGKKMSFNKKLMADLEGAYLERFKAINATYQVFLCRGQR